MKTSLLATMVLNEVRLRLRPPEQPGDRAGCHCPGMGHDTGPAFRYHFTDNQKCPRAVQQFCPGFGQCLTGEFSVWPGRILSGHVAV